MRKIAIALAALALAAAGCISGEPGAASQETKRPATVVEEPTETPTPVAEETEVPEVPLDLKFGETQVYDDGVELTVSKPERLERPYPDSTWEEEAKYGSGIPEGTVPIKIAVKVFNGGAETIDPSFTSGTVLAGDQQLDDQCFLECNINLTQLRPGRSVKATWTYFMPKGAALTVEVAPTFEHEPALYS